MLQLANSTQFFYSSLRREALRCTIIFKQEAILNASNLTIHWSTSQKCNFYTSVDHEAEAETEQEIDKH